jgi:hypothetical protein
MAADKLHDSGIVLMMSGIGPIAEITEVWFCVGMMNG